MSLDYGLYFVIFRQCGIFGFSFLAVANAVISYRKNTSQTWYICSKYCWKWRL